MKITIFCLLLFLGNEAISQETQLEIKFEGISKPTMIYFRDLGNELSYSLPIYLDSGMTDYQGKLTKSFSIEEPKAVMVSGGNHQRAIYLDPGDEIAFTLPEDFRYPIKTYSGKGSEKIPYLQKSKDYLNFLTFVEYDSSEVYQKAKEQIDLYDETLVEIEDSKFSRAFKNYLKAELLHNEYYFWGTFPMYIKMYKGIALEKDETQVTKTEDEIISKMDHYFPSQSLRSDYMKIISIKANQSGNTSESAIYDLIKNSDLDTRAKEMLFGMKLLSDMQFGNVHKAAPNMEIFHTLFPQSIYKMELQREFESWQGLAVGELAPDFTAKDTLGNEFKLSQLKGKVVYIDIWATWCGPCISEFPHAKKLKKDYEGNDKIVFLYVSVDQVEKTWLNYLQKDPAFTGYHVNDPGNFNSNIAKLYKVNGIPRYILVDHEGKIHNIMAPRPSSNVVIKDELNKMLSVIE
ncbi:TlpA family protein disulfide reductase [Belliella sp. DSM 111904]|uniref:TlpA family protein disulfide reductase n=1 Tax=Belliella filtrata TaxID=2923435 RepID=A0ABS9V3F6_9BACT|nr:TlpA disulfide reductase family protein [Belliella filtrata]MCH7410941.1 TlpA family protein disulfide reductase [Belliella filtrata]